MKKSEQLLQIYQEKIRELTTSPEGNHFNFSYIQPVINGFEESKIPKLKTIHLEDINEYKCDGYSYEFMDRVGWYNHGKEFKVVIPFTFFDDPEVYNKKVKEEFDALMEKKKKEKIAKKKRVEKDKTLQEIQLLKQLQEKYKDVV